MLVKKTNRQLIAIQNFILGGVANKRLPQRLGFAIAMLNMNIEIPVKCYTEELKKITDRYSDSFSRDEDGNTVIDKNLGIPVVESPADREEYLKEINELLSVETEIRINTVSPDIFDYSDEKYDPLTVVEILMLRDILCEEATE